jgi:hypothetical protein
MSTAEFDFLSDHTQYCDISTHCQAAVGKQVPAKTDSRLRNNRGISVNILTATNKGNNRRTNVSMRRPVNIPPLSAWQQYRCNYFLFGPRQVNARKNRVSIARQRSCKHASLTKEDIVFRGVRAEELSWRESALPVSQFSVGDSHGNFVVEEELEVDLWRRK